MVGSQRSDLDADPCISHILRGGHLARPAALYLFMFAVLQRLLDNRLRS